MFCLFIVVVLILILILILILCFSFVFFFYRLDYPGDYQFSLDLEQCVKQSLQRKGSQHPQSSNLKNINANKRSAPISPTSNNRNGKYNIIGNNGIHFSDSVESNMNADGHGTIYKTPETCNAAKGTKVTKPRKPPISRNAYLVEALIKHNDNENNDASLIVSNDYNSLNVNQICQTSSSRASGPGGDARRDQSGVGSDRCMTKSVAIDKNVKHMAKQEKKLRHGNVESSSSVTIDSVTMKPKRRRRRKRGKRKGKEEKIIIKTEHVL